MVEQCGPIPKFHPKHETLPGLISTHFVNLKHLSISSGMGLESIRTILDGLDQIMSLTLCLCMVNNAETYFDLILANHLPKLRTLQFATACKLNGDLVKAMVKFKSVSRLSYYVMSGLIDVEGIFKALDSIGANEEPSHLRVLRIITSEKVTWIQDLVPIINKYRSSHFPQLIKIIYIINGSDADCQMFRF